MSAKNELLVVPFPRGSAPLLTELCHCRWDTMRGGKASSWSWACPFYSAKWILPGSSCMLNCIKYTEAWMQVKILSCIWTTYFTSFRNWRGEKKEEKKKEVNLEVKWHWNFTPIFMKQKLDAGKELIFPFLTQLQRSIFLSTSELARAFIWATCFCCMLNS